MRPIHTKVLAIQYFPPPSTKKELMRFFGMVGYYRAFCPNFLTVVSLMNDLLNNSAKLVWSKKCQKAFDKVKLLLTSAHFLAAPRLYKPFKIQADASHIALDFIWVVISYTSKLLQQRWKYNF